MYRSLLEVKISNDRKIENNNELNIEEEEKVKIFFIKVLNKKHKNKNKKDVKLSEESVLSNENSSM